MWATWAHKYICTLYAQYHCYDVQFSSLLTCGTSHAWRVLRSFLLLPRSAQHPGLGHILKNWSVQWLQILISLCALSSVTLSRFTLYKCHLQCTYISNTHIPSILLTTNQTKIRHHFKYTRIFWIFKILFFFVFCFLFIYFCIIIIIYA